MTLECLDPPDVDIQSMPVEREDAWIEMMVYLECCLWQYLTERR